MQKNTVKISLYASAIIVLLMFLSDLVVAETDTSQSILWVGDLSVGHKTYGLKQQNIRDNVDFAANPSFRTLNVSLTAAIKNSYLSVNYDTSLSDFQESKINPLQSNRQEDFGYSRTDSNVTLGYNLNKSLSMFGGYLFGETEISYTFIEQVTGTTQNGVDVIRADGLFVGTNYGFDLQQAGTINVNIAYANLAGKYQYTLTIGQGVFDGSIIGVTSGFSFGIKYKRLYSAAIYYYLGVKINKYEFESDNGTFKTEEDFTIVSTGITKYFF